MSEKTLHVNRRQFKKLVASGALFGLAGCLGDDGEDGTPTGDVGFYDTISVGLGEQASQITTFDPYNENQGVPDFQAQVHLFDHLISRDRDMEMVGGLATDWEALSDTEWRFDIREGVEFHHGATFDAEAAKGSLELMMDGRSPPLEDHIGRFIEDISVEGDYELVITTPEPAPTLLTRLSSFTMMVDPDRYTDATDDERRESPSGTGAFQLDEWVSDERLVYTKFDNWWGGEPLIDELIFRFIPEPSVRVGALTQDEIQAAPRIPPSMYGIPDESEDHFVDSTPVIRQRWWEFDPQLDPVFEDKRVRQACNYAVDIETVIEEILNGFGEPIGQPCPEFVFGHNPDLEPYPYDPDEAETLLSEAGYGDGFQTEFLMPSEDPWVEFNQALVGQLGEVGIEVEFNNIPFANYLDRLLDREAAPLLGTSWGNFRLFDGAGTFFDKFHCDGDWGYTCYPEEYNPLIEEAATSVDRDRRLEIYQDLSERVHENADVLFTVGMHQVHGVAQEFDRWDARSNEFQYYNFTE